MKKLFIFLTFGLCGCASVSVPTAYQYREIQTPQFTLAAWVKETSPNAPFQLYIEGDSAASSAFSSKVMPKSRLMRQMAFADKSANVAYVARPCQFVQDPFCDGVDWSTARFAEPAVRSLAFAIGQIIGKRDATVYAYDGGALLSGLVIKNYPELKVRKWITYAGLLNHTSWTEYRKLPPLTQSLDLEQLPNVPQGNLVGEKDKVIPLKLSEKWTVGKKLVIVPGVSHNGPFKE